MWLHSPGSGIFQLNRQIGKKIKKGEQIGFVADPFGSSKKYDLIALESGIISAATTYPHVFEGQRLIELALTTETHESPIEVPLIEPNIIDY